MNPRNRTIAIVASAAVLAGGAGIGVAAGGDSAASDATPSMNRSGPGGPGGFDLSALAEELGVTESRLQEALEAARPDRSAGGAPDGSTMAQTLADELGLAVDEVQAALEATMPQGGMGGPPQGAPDDSSAATS